MGVSLRVGGQGAGRTSSATEQLLDALDVGLGDGCEPAEVARFLARLDLHTVAEAGLLAHELAAPRHADPLGGSLVRLVLGHGGSYFPAGASAGVVSCVSCRGPSGLRGALDHAGAGRLLV